MKRFLLGCVAIVKDAFSTHLNKDCTLVWDGKRWIHDETNIYQVANNLVISRNEWQQRISDALGVTWQELHGGGATIYGELDKCESRIKELLAERDAGWHAAYTRGFVEGKNDARTLP